MDITKTITELLKSQNLYHETDAILINEISFNLEMMEIAKADIRENGIVTDITRNTDKEPYFHKNRSVDVYQMALKNVQGLFRQLILSPSERHKMKLELSKAMDEFEKNFG